MSEYGPASDAIAAELLIAGERAPRCEMPGACAFCNVNVQMVNARFRNVLSGELHTCPDHLRDRYGRGYVRGSFVLGGAHAP